MAEFRVVLISKDKKIDDKNVVILNLLVWGKTMDDIRSHAQSCAEQHDMKIHSLNQNLLEGEQYLKERLTVIIERNGIKEVVDVRHIDEAIDIAISQMTKEGDTAIISTETGSRVYTIEKKAGLFNWKHPGYKFGHYLK